VAAAKVARMGPHLGLPLQTTKWLLPALGPLSGPAEGAGEVGEHLRRDESGMILSVLTNCYHTPVGDGCKHGSFGGSQEHAQ